MSDKKKLERKLKEKLDNDVALGKVEDVYDDYVYLISVCPDNTAYYGELLRCIYATYQYTDLDKWDKLLHKAIDLSQKARIYTKSDKERSSFYMHEYEFIVELIRFDGNYSIQYGDELLMSLLDNVILNDSENSLAIREKGNLYQANGEYKKAEAEYERAMKIEEDDSLLYNMALNKELAENKEEAIQTYQKLYEVSDSFVIKQVALESLIRIYKKAEDMNKVKYYEDLLSEIEE